MRNTKEAILELKKNTVIWQKKSYTTKLCIIDIFLMGFHFHLSDLSFERTGKNCSLPSLKVVDSDLKTTLKNVKNLQKIYTIAFERLIFCIILT
jgi:hypothetical protein